MQPAHVKTALSFVGKNAIISISPLLPSPSRWHPFCLEKFLRVQVPLGCVKTAFVTQGAGKLRICQDNGSEYKFACVGSHPSLVTKGATVEVVFFQGATIVFPSCACHLSRLGPHLYSKCGCTRKTSLAQLPE